MRAWNGSGNSNNSLISLVEIYAGFDEPNGYFLCNGQAVNRILYAALMSKITFKLTASTTTGSSIITVNSSLSLYIGEKIEGAGIPANATITAITDSTHITISANATATAANINATVFPYGNGDSSTTFNVPNINGRVIVGKDASQSEFNAYGESGGEKAHQLTILETPAHNHTNGSYNQLLKIDNTNTTGMTDNSNGEPRVNASGTMQPSGGNGAHNNLQPYIVMNYIIKY